MAPTRHLNNSLSYGNPDELVAEYWALGGGPKVSKDPGSRQFLKACHQAEMAHLRHFNCEEHRMPQEYRDVLSRGVKLVERLLRIEDKLSFPMIHDLNLVRFAKHKYPGVYYRVKGYMSRGEAHEEAVEDAREAWENLLCGERVTPHDVRMGGRGKITDVLGSDPCVGRMILMLSHRDLLVLGAVEQRLTECYTDDKYPVAIGRRWCHGYPSMFVKTLQRYAVHHCFDAKKYDANISTWMVGLALRILRRQFRDGENGVYDAYWEFVRESLVDVTIQRDDGIRMTKHKGTTSGHSFNTLVQSIITLIIGYTAVCYLARKKDISDEELMKRCRIESLGDDNIISLDKSLAQHHLGEIADVVRVIFGIDWSGRKSFTTHNILDEKEYSFSGIQFLGKYLYLEPWTIKGVKRMVATPYRPFQETLERLYYPEYESVSMHQTYQRTLGNYIDAAGNRETARWLDGFLDWLERRGACMDKVSDEEGFVAKGRWTRERWLLFTHCKKQVHTRRKHRLVQARQRPQRRIVDRRRDEMQGRGENRADASGCEQTDVEGGRGYTSCEASDGEVPRVTEVSPGDVSEVEAVVPTNEGTARNAVVSDVDPDVIDLDAVAEVASVDEEEITILCTSRPRTLNVDTEVIDADSDVAEADEEEVTILRSSPPRTSNVDTVVIDADVGEEEVNTLPSSHPRTFNVDAEVVDVDAIESDAG